MPAGVLYVANSAQIGGGNRVLMDIIRSLDRRRYSPVLVVPGRGPAGDWGRREGIPVHIVPGDDLAGTASTLKRAAALTPILLRRRIRLIHAGAPACYRAVSLAAGCMGAKRVCHLGAPPTADELAWCFRSGPELVVACHRAQARDAEPMVRAVQPKAQVVAVTNGIDTTAIRHVDRGADQWRFGASRVVATVGNLSPIKGFADLIRAARVLIQELGSDLAFVVVGGDLSQTGYQRTLETLASEEGVRDFFHFVGWRAEISEILSAADVVVLPSHLEGMPLSVLEAMACGRPVVATRVGGIPEAVVDGETGILVEPRQPAQLAAGLLRILRDPNRAAQMGKLGRDRVERSFSIERVAADVRQLYDSLLETI